MSKSALRFGAKHISKSKCTKHQGRTTFRSWDVEKAHAVVARSTFRSQNAQSTTCSRHFWRFRCRFAWQAQDKSMFIRGVRRSGRWFPERGCILEHVGLLRWFLRDRCGTSYDLASLCCGRRNTADRWTWKITKRIGTRPSALHSTFHFWRKSRRIALFLMLSRSKMEEVSQHCFVLDVVKFKKRRRLAELLRFWCCQLQKMRKSRRIASFLTLSCANSEEVSQNSFLFKLADRQVDRQVDRKTGRQTDRQRDRQRDREIDR